MIKYAIITPPAEHPVTTAEAKEHCRVPSSETGDDAYIASLITAGTNLIENITNRKLITQTIEYYLDEFPTAREFELPFGYVQAVASIKYYDQDGNLNTWSADNYQLNNKGIVSSIKLTEQADYPTTQTDKIDAVVVRFTSGYGAESSVPNAIKQALLLFISSMYDNREGAQDLMTKTLELLLASYRIYHFA
jgi:uncharacterized phiE125 gp8 family phage protein